VPRRREKRLQIQRRTQLPIFREARSARRAHAKSANLGFRTAAKMLPRSDETTRPQLGKQDRAVVDDSFV
jgi:hypothetical protein